MQHPDALNQVAEFHKTFKHPIGQKPKLPTQARAALRIALIREELEELEAAVNDQDLTAAADALCDIQYVLSGAILEFGLGEKFKALFDEVQRSNMSKSCKTREEAEQTVSYYRHERGVESIIEESDGHFLVYRKGDRKTLKSINYSPADLEAILQR
jgi:predicted HAD superfamily Cof-like phosphohydrolase